MTIINTVSDSRFSLNGVQYLKNYISAVRGNRVEIFNCYERADVLLPLTHYAEVTLNGIMYTSAPLLQAALLDVIYSRHTLGLQGLQDQDNIDIKKTFRYTPGESTASILAKINNLPAYTVNEKQSVWFIGSQSARLSPILGGTPIGGGTIPLTPSTSITPVNLNPAIVKYKMMVKGKGTYGQGGIQLTSAHIELMYTNQATNQEMEDDPETDFITFTLAANQTIVQWLNTRSPAIAVQPQDEGYTIFKGYNAQAEALSYLWVGEGGTYGTGQGQAATADFQALQGTTPAPFMPTFHQTLQQNPLTTHSPQFYDENANMLMALGAGIIKIRYPNAQTLYIQGQAPQDDFSVTIPTLYQDDHFLLRSEVKNRWVMIRVLSDTNTLYVPELIGAQEVVQIGGHNMVYNDLDSLDGFGFNPQTGVISGFDFYAGFKYNINFLL
ncbi:hypothetical protein AM493_13845 [Flavobacterium akiainvivens]|uniref:Uncharacterized protein n=1 Tax=Flavobacterium akiainvivens TaxID=1202724 RepID=A0A0M9VIU0_9FLAO|nr:hypothetical protein [Flavobacterium akiainvivens]KOS06992.1 hypothetical protein AM493_13845 [Flavobacterium akiainvivens]SFQ59444.1 hypothetical protein SAMN05444144_109108 [Flavobacterium akiainvivens]